MMNHQEGQFMPPDNNQEGQFEARPINTDFREQGQWQETASYQSEKIQPKQRRKQQSISPGCLIPAILAAVMLVAIFGGASAFKFTHMPGFHPGPKMMGAAHTFNTGQHPVLIIHDQYGSIHVHTQQSNSVRVQTNHDDADIVYDQSKDQNTITITVHPNDKEHFFPGDSVDFEVDVPTTSDLQLDTDAGDIQVDGVQGQMQLNSKAGTIETDGTTITGTSTLQTDAGTITYNGTMDANGNYQFTSNAGMVDISIPENSSLHIDAKTDIGSIDSDFQSITIQEHTTGAEAHGDIGSNPTAHVTIQTNAGSIQINNGR